jgi:hypothetical protein
MLDRFYDDLLDFLKAASSSADRYVIRHSFQLGSFPTTFGLYSPLNTECGFSECF